MSATRHHSDERSSKGVMLRLKNLAVNLQTPAAGQKHAVLFVIPGGSGGFPSVNLDLYRDSPAFRDSIDCTGALVEAVLEWPAAAAYRGEKAAPTTPAIERRNELVHHGMTRIALIDQWSAEGVTADGAIGVSLGELISPYAVGAISREDCTQLVAVLAQAITEQPSAHRVYLVEVNGETARRLCRNAPACVDFLGTSSHTLSLVLCRETDSEIIRTYFGRAVVHEAPSGWPYHTPAMRFDYEWTRAQLGRGVALLPPLRPIYSPAAGALLPGDTNLDAQFLYWAMSSPCHFATAVSTALADGFGTVVQVAGRPMQVFGDVSKQAAAESRRVTQFHALDANAPAQVRAMKRRPITPLAANVQPMPPLEDGWWRVAPEESRDLATEQVCERLLQPLLEGKPFDIVSGLADPLADVMAVDRDALRRFLASSVLRLLRDESIRRRIKNDPRLIRAMVDASIRAGPAVTQPVQPALASAALRTLLLIAPDFAALQPLGTVDLVNGRIPQLVIAMKTLSSTPVHS